MQIVRMIVWVLLLVALLLFSALNWKPAEVKIWEGLILETKLPALVIVSFLLGLVPMWLLNKTQRFYMNRKISSLESAARTASATPVATRTATNEAVVATPAPAETDEPLVPESEKPRDNLSPEAR